MREYDIGIIAVYRASTGAEYKEIHYSIKDKGYIYALYTAIKIFEGEYKDWKIIKTFLNCHLTDSQKDYIKKEIENAKVL